MSNDERTEATAGDWVLVWGQVEAPDVISGETRVRFESHNAHYAGLVRNAHLVLGQGTPPDVAECTSLYKIYVREGKQGIAYIVCDKHHDHSGRHGSAEHDVSWSDGESGGFLERQ